MSINILATRTYRYFSAFDINLLTWSFDKVQDRLCILVMLLRFGSLLHLNLNCLKIRMA